MKLKVFATSDFDVLEKDVNDFLEPSPGTGKPKPFIHSITTHVSMFNGDMIKYVFIFYDYIETAVFDPEKAV